jgi:hypothetical protein
MTSGNILHVAQRWIFLKPLVAPQQEVGGIWHKKRNLSFAFVLEVYDLLHSGLMPCSLRSLQICLFFT